MQIFDFTWNYQWELSIIANNALCVNPNVNLISNIGFSPEGTHTTDSDNPRANKELESLEKIIHPKEIIRSMFIDEYVMREAYDMDATLTITEIRGIKKLIKYTTPFYRLFKKK